MKKLCPQCNTEKEFSEFYKHRSMKDGLQHYCKLCWKARQSSGTFKKKRREYTLNSETSAKRKDYHRSWQLMTKYGITLAEYKNALVLQNERCAICDKHQLDCHNGLYVDHDHETKKFRQLLCRECNTGIGHFRESEELLTKAIQYLRRHKSKLRVIKGVK